MFVYLFHRAHNIPSRRQSIVMARGGSKRKLKPKSKFDKRREFKQKKKKPSSNGRDIKHRDQFKRAHADSLNDKAVKRQKVADLPDDEESDEEVDVYKQFLVTFSQKKPQNNTAVESEDEDNEESVSDGSDTACDESLPNLPNSEENCRENDGNDTESENDQENSDKSSGDESCAENEDCPPTVTKEENNDESTWEHHTDSDEDDDMDPKFQDDLTPKEGDPFAAHICRDLYDEAVDVLTKPKVPAQVENIQWPTLGSLVASIPQLPESPKSSEVVSKISLEEPKVYAQPGKVPTRLSKLDLNQLHIKVQLHGTISRANEGNIEAGSQDILTPRQMELFTLMNGYQDLYYPDRTLLNGEEVRFSYCLHAANHIIKTRNIVLHHNSRLNKKNSSNVPDEFRDQGLVRPKVLIIVPFREQARRVVEMLIKLLVRDEGKGSVMNRKRFEEEFSGDELVMPKKNPRPEDYEKLFSGNTDDTFRLGITLTKKSLKLYADFYSADIIVASPLGLRMIVGAEGESERDYDFLASIEVVILDQAEVFLMQNWDHLLHVWDHFHLQPRESHGTDFSRVRLWAVNGWAKYYRQTIILSSVALLELSSLLNKRCTNYAGSVRAVKHTSSGTICQVVVQLPQVFQRLEAPSVTLGLDVRFDFLIRKVLPDHTDPLMAHTMIYVPSYFDFVRIRNYLRKQGLSFVQICEYTKEGKVARARDMFYHSQVQFLLYSERFHFFRRPLIKGIRHIVFYQPPTIPHFYSEMCNQMQEANQNPYGGSENNMTVTVLYNKYDAPKLSAIVGSERASRMTTSDRNVHMFMAGE